MPHKGSKLASKSPALRRVRELGHTDSDSSEKGMAEGGSILSFFLIQGCVLEIFPNNF